MTTLEPTLTFDFRKAIDKNHLRGIWKMMVDYRLPYLGATAALAGIDGNAFQFVHWANLIDSNQSVKGDAA